MADTTPLQLQYNTSSHGLQDGDDLLLRLRPIIEHPRGRAYDRAVIVVPPESIRLILAMVEEVGAQRPEVLQRGGIALAVPDRQLRRDDEWVKDLDWPVWNTRSKENCQCYQYFQNIARLRGAVAAMVAVCGGPARACKRGCQFSQQLKVHGYWVMASSLLKDESFARKLDIVLLDHIPGRGPRYITTGNIDSALRNSRLEPYWSFLSVLLGIMQSLPPGATLSHEELLRRLAEKDVSVENLPTRVDEPLLGDLQVAINGAVEKGGAHVELGPPVFMTEVLSGLGLDVSLHHAWERRDWVDVGPHESLGVCLRLFRAGDSLKNLVNKTIIYYGEDGADIEYFTRTGWVVYRLEDLPPVVTEKRKVSKEQHARTVLAGLWLQDIYPSSGELAKVAGADPSSVSDYVRLWERDRLVRREAVRSGGRGRPKERLLPENDLIGAREISGI